MCGGSRLLCAQLSNVGEVNATVSRADVVLLILGLANFVTNGEGVDRPDYNLPGKQVALVELVAEFQKPVVAIVLSGMAVGIDVLARTGWGVG